MKLIDADRLKKYFQWWRETPEGKEWADVFEEIIDAQPEVDLDKLKEGKE